MFTDDDLLEPDPKSTPPSASKPPTASISFERTPVPYPTSGPTPDETWAAYFRRVKGRDEPEPEEEEGDDDEPAGVGEVLERGDLDELAWKDWCPGGLKTYQKLLEKHGFETRGGYRISLHAGGVFGKTAKNPGEPKPDKTERVAFVEGYRKDRGLIKIHFRDSGSGKFQPYLRMINNEYRLLSDGEAKEWIKHEDTGD